MSEEKTEAIVVGSWSCTSILILRDQQLFDLTLAQDTGSGSGSQFRSYHVFSYQFCLVTQLTKNAVGSVPSVLSL